MKEVNELSILKKIVEIMKEFKFTKVQNKFMIKIYSDFGQITSYSDNLENAVSCLKALAEMSGCENFLNCANYEEIQEVEFDIKDNRILFKKK